MRRILVDHARTRKRVKRGGSDIRVSLDEATTLASSTDLDIVALDQRQVGARQQRAGTGGGQPRRGLQRRVGYSVDDGLMLGIDGDPERRTDLGDSVWWPSRQSSAAAARSSRRRTRRHGKASIVLMRNPRFLNAEDESTLPNVETAVDLALLVVAAILLWIWAR